MSRQSYAAPSYAARMSMAQSAYRGRDSVMPPQADYTPTLDECVRAAEACSRTLSQAADKFSKGVEDMARLQKVFKTEHHFLIIPDQNVAERWSEYEAHLNPYVDSLLSRAGALLEKEAQAVKRLEQRLADIEQARAEHTVSSSSSLDLLADDEPERSSPLDSIDSESKLSAPQKRKVAMLRNQRQKMLDEMARLR